MSAQRLEFSPPGWAGHVVVTGRATATILFTDLVGSTELRSRLRDEAADAVDVAVGIQQAVDRLNRSGKTGVPLEVRVGLSAGDVSFEDDDVHGTPVVEASRLCGAAAGGRMLLARAEPGDPERAHDLLHQALDSARRLGSANVERRAVELLGEFD